MTDTLEDLKLQQAELVAIAKHGDRIVKDSAERAPSGKITVLIRTKGLDGEYDGNTRRVATSDVHQVFHLPEVKKELAKAKAKERRGSKSVKQVDALKEKLREMGVNPDEVLAEAKTEEPAETEETFDIE
jgi:hypothetical protein